MSTTAIISNALSAVSVAKDLGLLGIKYYDTLVGNSKHLGSYLELCVENKTSLKWQKLVVLDSHFLKLVKEINGPNAPEVQGLEKLMGGLSAWSQMALELKIKPDQLEGVTEHADYACVIDGKVAAKASIETLALLILHGQRVEIDTVGPLSVISSSIGRLAVAPKNEAGAIAHIILEKGAAEVIGGNQVAFRELRQFSLLPNQAGAEFLRNINEFAEDGYAILLEDKPIYVRRHDREPALITFVLALRQCRDSLSALLLATDPQVADFVNNMVDLPWESMQSSTVASRLDFRYKLLRLVTGPPDEEPRPELQGTPSGHLIHKFAYACAVYGLSLSVDTKCQGCKFAYLA